MKKVILSLLVTISLFSCKNDGKKDNGSNKSVTIDTTNVCYQQSFVYDFQYTLNDGKTDTIKRVSNQPNFNQCQNGKWCLMDAKTSNVIASDVKSYKVLSHYFDTTQYVTCCGK
jgi:hypothetical protein